MKIKRKRRSLIQRIKDRQEMNKLRGLPHREIVAYLQNKWNKENGHAGS